MLLEYWLSSKNDMSCLRMDENIRCLNLVVSLSEAKFKNKTEIDKTRMLNNPIPKNMKKYFLIFSIIRSLSVSV
jgi:hypothetical protein